MIKPVIYDELFVINDGLTPEFNDGVIYIDNFYKNYEDIYEMLNNSHVPQWKSSKSSRNFLDYYDCRLELNNDFFGDSYFTRMKSLAELIRYFYKDDRDLKILEADYKFNFYKNINTDVSNHLQHYPHVDSVYNAIVFLDKICSGGTAIYPTIKDLENIEDKNLLFDVSEYEKKIIKSKPNRLVIFQGTQYHGGYIEDHNKYTGENWRINQVMFFDEVEH